MSTVLGKSNNTHISTFADEGLMRQRQPHRGWRSTLGRHLPNLDGERIGAWRAVIAGVQTTVDEPHAADIHRFFPTLLDSHCNRVSDLQLKGYFGPT